MATVIDGSGVDEVPATQLPDRYEVIHGEVVELPPMSSHARRIANRLKTAIDRYLTSRDTGECGVEVLFRIPQPGDRTRNRLPDLYFVSYDRWPKDRPSPLEGNAWEVVPDLVAEVVSPGDSADDLIAKVREYLAGGVRLAWVVYPLAREIHTYLPGTRPIGVHMVTDQLDASGVLPGFTAPVADLFPPRDEPPVPPEG